MATAWAKLSEKERRRLIKLAEHLAGSAEMPHRSTIPPVDENQERMISQHDAASLLGITLRTLHRWERQGWLEGRELLSNAVFFPESCINLAAIRAADAKSNAEFNKLSSTTREYIRACLKNRKEIEGTKDGN